MATAIEVLPCPSDLRAAALKLVLRELALEQQVALATSLQSTANPRVDPFDALIVAIQDRHLTAAAWAQLQPGRVATLWYPQFAGEYDATVAGKLVKATTNRAKSFDIAMLQSIVASEDSKSAKSLLDAGFTHAANLIYLEWIPADLGDHSSFPLTFEAYDERDRVRLANLLEKTYRGSLDCPRLDSIRSLEDTIEGYRATGEYDPNLWSFAQEASQDVGVVLLTNYANTRQMELIYMGVAPSARGLGHGAALLRHAQRIAIENRSEKLLLAVDAANAPALKLYREAGFQEWSRRSVYIF